MRGKIWNFRKPDESRVMRFENDGETFSAKYKAVRWLLDNGYKYGSTDWPSPYVAAVRSDKYDLPQKMHNFDREDYDKVDAVMYSHDYREGFVEIWILK